MGAVAPQRDTNAPFDRVAVEALAEGVYYVDNSRQILFWNAAAERLSGHKAADVVGRRCYDHVLRHVDEAGNELCFSVCPLAATVVDGQARQACVYLHHKEGHRQAVRVTTLPVRNASGAIVGAAEIFSDGGEQARVRERLEELERQALIDPLTAVGNRRFLEMTLTMRSEELGRYGWPYGILLLDLDRFKRINHRYGHEIGDKALKMVASTLVHCSRGTDAVGRWGGDEFMVVIANATVASLQAASERVRSLIERSTVEADSGPTRATVSIGGVLASPDTSIAELLQAVDRRMNAAKSRGRNCTAVQGV